MVFTLKTFTTRIEVEIAKSKLKVHGIDSHIFADDAGGAVPSPMAHSFGVTLKLDEHDAEEPRQILEINETEK